MVKEVKVPPDALPNARAWVESTGKNGCTLFLQKGKQQPGDVAHELVHVLQFLSIARNMDFQIEHEHFGYLMHWLMGEVLGYKWE